MGILARNMMTMTVSAALLASATGCSENNASSPAPEIEEQEKTVAEDPKIAVVNEMIEAWNVRDWDKVAELFTEDGVLHSMMIKPVVGREAIGKRISAMGANISEIKLNIRNIGRINDVVVIERTDEFTYNGHKGKVPVVGVLEVEGDKVKEWREYYDRAELISEMGLESDFDTGS